MMLGITIVVVSLFAAIGLTRPWWGGAISQGVSRQRANVLAFKQRFAEIDQEVAAGSLDMAAGDALKSELQQRLLEDARNQEVVPTQQVRRWPAVLVAVALPLFAGIWYYEGGSWRVENQLQQAAANPGAAQDMAVETMVERLAQRLKSQPDDAEGWAMLGRSYFVLKRYAESAQAYSKANTLIQPPDPDLLVAEGGALGLAAGGDLSGRPRQLFENALNIDDKHLRALWFLGTSSYQQRDFPQAQAYWERLLRLELPEDLRADVTARVQELSGQTGQPAQIASAPPPKSVGTAAVALHIKVQLSPAMMDKRKPDQVLYVFAKAAQGPPMPLAVQKLHPSSWPVKVTLDDSMAMAPALRLSQFDRWTVTARLGGEGTPTAQSGDLQGHAEVARADAEQNVDILISEQVP